MYIYIDSLLVAPGLFAELFAQIHGFYRCRFLKRRNHIFCVVLKKGSYEKKTKMKELCPPKKGPWLKRKFSSSEPTIWISGDILFVFQGEESFHVFHSGFEEGPGGYMVDLRTSLWWTEACESSRNNWKKPKGNLHMQHGCELLSMLTVHCKATNPSPSSEKNKTSI